MAMAGPRRSTPPSSSWQQVPRQHAGCTPTTPRWDGVVDGLVDDIYDPSLDATLRQLRRRLVDLPVDGREVLVVGGNAAALEFISASREVRRDLRARLTVLSPTGRPRHWRRRKDAEVAELVAIAALRTQAAGGETVTAKHLYEAVAADLEAAVDAGTDVAAVQEIVTSIPFFLPLFDAKDRAALAGRYGIPISNLLRQDCGDGIAIIEAAIDTGAVVFRAGRYRHCRPEGRYFRVTATDEDGRQDVHDTRYGAIVGAIGFEGVSTTRAPVIQNLLRTGTVGPIELRRGTTGRQPIPGSARALRRRASTCRQCPPKHVDLARGERPTDHGDLSGRGALHCSRVGRRHVERLPREYRAELTHCREKRFRDPDGGSSLVFNLFCTILTGR